MPCRPDHQNWHVRGELAGDKSSPVRQPHRYCSRQGRRSPRLTNRAIADLSSEAGIGLNLLLSETSDLAPQRFRECALQGF